MNYDDFEEKTFGELQVGDILIDGDGNETKITKAYDIHTPEKMYELTFEDGTVSRASGNHLWYVELPNDKKNHSRRLRNSKKLFKKYESHQDLENHVDWKVEALMMAEAEENYEIGAKDLVAFFDFITDERDRFELIDRVLKSIGHIVEETTEYRDIETEESIKKFEKVFDARRAFQQFLSLTGIKEFSEKWPVIVGRVVTTQEIFEKYPDADIPTLQLPRISKKEEEEL